MKALAKGKAWGQSWALRKVLQWARWSAVSWAWSKERARGQLMALVQAHAKEPMSWALALKGRAKALARAQVSVRA